MAKTASVIGNEYSLMYIAYCILSSLFQVLNNENTSFSNLKDETSKLKHQDISLSFTQKKALKIFFQ